MPFVYDRSNLRRSARGVVSHPALRGAQFFGNLTGIQESIMSGRLSNQAMLQSLAITGETGCYRTTRKFWSSRSAKPLG
jgi:hypothetical protein